MIYRLIRFKQQNFMYDIHTSKSYLAIAKQNIEQSIEKEDSKISTWKHCREIL